MVKANRGSVVFGVGGIVLAGCASPRASVPAAAVATGRSEVREPAPVAVAYAVRDGAAGRTFLAGKSTLASAPLVVEADEHDAKARTSLRLRAHREPDGSLVVEARYEERGERNDIQWSPTVRIAPRTRTVVELRGGEWSRALEITGE